VASSAGVIRWTLRNTSSRLSSRPRSRPPCLLAATTPLFSPHSTVGAIAQQPRRRQTRADGNARAASEAVAARKRAGNDKPRHHFSASTAPPSHAALPEVPLAESTIALVAVLVAAAAAAAGLWRRRRRSSTAAAAGAGGPDAPPADLISRLRATGDEGLLEGWDRLSPQQRADHAARLSAADLDGARAAHRALLAAAGGDLGRSGSAALAHPDARPAVATAPLSGAGAPSSSQRAARRRAGLAAAAAGRVGLVTLAGGRGTRLGHDGPKGLMDLGLPSGKCLLALQAERCTAVERAGRAERGEAPSSSSSSSSPTPACPWILLVSESTREATLQALVASNAWGRPLDSVVLVCQGGGPVPPGGGGNEGGGAPFLEAAGRLATSPDGNGGLYAALADPEAMTTLPLPGGSSRRAPRRGETCLAWLERRGVHGVDIVACDNALAPVLDPEFIGHCLGVGSDPAAPDRPPRDPDAAVAFVGVRAVARRGPDEAVGALALLPLPGGKEGLGVVEYTELGEERASATDAAGDLRWRWANVCLQWTSTEALRRVARAVRDEDRARGGGGGGAGDAGSGARPWLPWHPAVKDVPCLPGSSADSDAAGGTGGGGRRGVARGAVKLERFVFDPWPALTASGMGTWVVQEVERSESFAPVKHAEGRGADTARAARDALLTRGGRWARVAGASVAGRGGTLGPLTAVEGVRGALDVVASGVERSRTVAAAGPRGPLDVVRLASPAAPPALVESGRATDSAPDGGVEISPLVSFGGEGLEGLSGSTLREGGEVVAASEA